MSWQLMLVADFDYDEYSRVITAPLDMKNSDACALIYHGICYKVTELTVLRVLKTTVLTSMSALPTPCTAEFHKTYNRKWPPMQKKKKNALLRSSEQIARAR